MRKLKTAMRELWATVRDSPRGTTSGVLLTATVLCLVAYVSEQTLSIRRIARPTGNTGHGSSLVPELSRGKLSRTVVVLNSYHYGYSWSDHETDGVRDALVNHDLGVDVVVEYLDCKHHPAMEHFELLHRLFAEKFADLEVPVLVVLDNPALEFARRYRAEIFPKAAIVFCGINGYTPQTLAGLTRITGVAEKLAADRTLELALHLRPTTKRVTVLHDYTVTGRATRIETEAQLAPFAGRVAIDYLPDVSLAQLRTTLEALPRDAIVLAMSYSLDKDGRVVNLEAMAELTAESSPVPVFGLHEERLGHGIIGGRLLGGRSHAERAAAMAIRVLSGTPVEDIPVEGDSATRTMFDYRVLTRFGYTAADVPHDAIVVNLPVSFVTEHGDLVAAVLGIVLALMAIILLLLANMRRRRIAEAAQVSLQAQLWQSQKMEAIGQLAGGVAHDFNNILTAVLGFAELTKKILPAGSSALSLAEQVVFAAERGGKLTQGLLAFSRKQVLDPRPVDLNELVRGFENIAQRIIGEDIVLETTLTSPSVVIMADSGQIEQVLLNMCTNARDAMPTGGRLLIETAVLEIDEAYRKAQRLERTGPFGLLSISDTGRGMDERTRQHAFEPFFTTKEVGRGTGLGLSIVDGIVQQHHGSIHCYSEPGRGTTFKVLLPLANRAPEARARPLPPPSCGGTETILLVEDDTAVRSLVSIVLRNSGYTVIEAVDGVEAVERHTALGANVDLLLCDVIMPRQNGQQAYDAMRVRQPRLKVLFMSGYTFEIIRSRGLADAALPLLTKPVMPDELLGKVRAVLDAQLPTPRAEAPLAGAEPQR